MKFRLMAAALSLLLLGGCAAGTVPGQGPRRFEASFLTLFDTVTTIVGYAETEEDFRRTASSSTTSCWSTTRCSTSTTSTRASTT